MHLIYTVHPVLLRDKGKAKGGPSRSNFIVNLKRRKVHNSVVCPSTSFQSSDFTQHDCSTLLDRREKHRLRKIIQQIKSIARFSWRDTGGIISISPCIIPDRYFRFIDPFAKPVPALECLPAVWIVKLEVFSTKREFRSFPAIRLLARSRERSNKVLHFIQNSSSQFSTDTVKGRLTIDICVWQIRLVSGFSWRTNLTTRIMVRSTLQISIQRFTAWSHLLKRWPAQL